MKQKKVFYFDEELKKFDLERQEEKELQNAERLMKSANPKLKKFGQRKFAILTGQQAELD